MIELPNGLRARVSHWRYPAGAFATGAGMSALHLPHVLRAAGLAPDPVGGKTIVELFDETGRVITRGTATCRIPDEHGPGDNFNRKLGRTIALGRALKYAQEVRP